MASASSVLQFVQGVLKITKLIMSIGDVTPPGPRLLTLKDADVLIKSNNADSFGGRDFVDITDCRNRFYNILLPSIIGRGTLAASDITPITGALHVVFGDLKRDKDVVWNRLQQLDWLLTNSQLWDDSRHLFTRMVAEAYILLFHMHAVYAEMRRIQLGVNILEHRDLLPDTLAALNYVMTAPTKLIILSNFVRSRRQESIPVVAKGTWARVCWNYSDIYSPTWNTPTEDKLTSDKFPSHKEHCGSGMNSAGETWIRQEAQHRLDAVMEVYNDRTGPTVSAAIYAASTLTWEMNIRYHLQLGSKGSKNAPISDEELDKIIEESQEIPEDADAYLKFSEKLHSTIGSVELADPGEPVSFEETCKQLGVPV